MQSANIEKRIRANFSKYQEMYDRLPVFLQNALVTTRGYFLARLRYQKLFWQTLTEILSHDKFTKTELDDYQNQKLQNLVQHAYRHTTFYNGMMTDLNLHPEQIQTKDDLQLLPVLTRDQLKTKFKDMLVKEGHKRILVHTSGSQGSGLPIAYNEEDLARNWAFIVRQLCWANIKPREWRITLYGSKIVPTDQTVPPFWRYNLVEKQILLSIFHLSEQTKDDYLHFLETHQGLVLEGFASVLRILADFLIQEDKRISMKLVYSTGEPIDEATRQKVETAFNGKLLDCYGMTEWVGFIQECEKGAKHLASDYGILEILDEDNRAVAAGEEGYLVWTGLQREEMPFIRYRIGDKGMWSLRTQCECGRPYPLVDTTITRDSDIITTPDGDLYSPRVINQFLKNKVAFNFCQFIQESLDSLVIRIVPGNGNYQQEARALFDDLNKIFKGSLYLRVCFADRPLMRGQGKLPLIINQILN